VENIYVNPLPSTEIGQVGFAAMFARSIHEGKYQFRMRPHSFGAG
jgi:hypothetical protein